VAKNKSAQEAESIMGYFKRIFRANPKWLKGRSNAPVLQQYRIDNDLGPDDDIPDRVKSGMANAKTALKRRRRRGKRRAAEAAAAVTAVAMATPSRQPLRGSARATLDSLEEQIDECMISAKKLDKEHLGDVIHLLRRARNKVVLMGGDA
jgi:hypothetical protein